MITVQKIRHKIICLTAILILLPALFLSGQVITVNALLDTTRALIGDQLKLHLRVETPPGNTVTFPALQDTITGKIEVVRKWPVDTLLNQSGRIVLNQDLLVTVFDTGTFEIPPQSFAFKSGQLLDTLKTIPVSFEILSMPVDTTIRDIRANMKTPVNIAEIWPYALILIGLLLASLLIIYWIRKRKRKSLAVPSGILSEPAGDIALRDLEQLRKESWMQKQIKLYYIRLTEILRVYIERRFNIMALEQTTDEILDSLKKSAGLDPDLKRLAAILRLADLVKFAKVIPDQDENANQLNEAILFVRNTVAPKEEPKQESARENEPVPNNVES